MLFIDFTIATEVFKRDLGFLSSSFGSFVQHINKHTHTGSLWTALYKQHFFLLLLSTPILFTQYYVCTHCMCVFSSCGGLYMRCSITLCHRQIKLRKNWKWITRNLNLNESIILYGICHINLLCWFLKSYKHDMFSSIRH